MMTDEREANPVQKVSDEWRKLAIQFDAHRMQALWHLRAMLQDPAAHADKAKEFLQADPPKATRVPYAYVQQVPNRPPRLFFARDVSPSPDSDYWEDFVIWTPLYTEMFGREA